MSGIADTPWVMTNLNAEIGVHPVLDGVGGEP